MSLLDICKGDMYGPDKDDRYETNNDDFCRKTS
jgi:hypothetical protein